MILEKIVVGPLQTNCYIVGSQNSTDAIVIDPGAEPEKIESCLKRFSLKAKCIVNTHAHPDHIDADVALGAPVYIHRLDVDLLKTYVSLKQVNLLENGQKLSVGKISLEIIHTPGHTPGGVCLCADKFCFTGDTLFAQGVGRTDLPGGSEQDLIQSIQKKLFVLPDRLVIYPGHGPSSTIGQEKRDNLFT